MKCQNCGTEAGSMNFCPQCGAQVAQTVSNAPVTQGNPAKVLVFGILGLALGSLGVVGLVFSIIGLRMANGYRATYGDISNMVRHGRRLSIGGIVFSIVMTVFWIAYIFLITYMVTQVRVQYF